MFGYSLNYLIDLANAIIVDVEATPTRISKRSMPPRRCSSAPLIGSPLRPTTSTPTSPMAPARCSAGWSGAYPHIPVWDQSEVSANGKFPRADFAYDHERDLYICPGGKELKTSGTVHDGTTIKYIAKRSDCAVCPLKRHCTTGLERRISRDIHQDARDYTRRLCRPRLIGSHAPQGRGSKPCLARPSIFTRWCASDCAASAAPGTSSCSPPPSRISNAWQCTPQGGRHSP